MVRLALVAAGVAGLTACAGAERDGGPGALEHYHVGVEIRDEPDINTPQDPQRELRFQFSGDHVTSPARCASLRDAVIRFAGTPLQPRDKGGWLTDRLPTNNAPGDTINQDHCEAAVILLVFPRTGGEPQNGTLEIEGKGRLRTVPVNHPVGEPQLSVMSAALGRVVVQVQGLPARPAIEALSITYWPRMTRRISVQRRWLGEDGLLEVLLPPEAAEPQGGLDGSLSVTIDLGSEAVACVGFEACRVRAVVVRDLPVHAAGP